MKKIIFLAAFLVSGFAMAKDIPQFSAFAKGDELFVTILGDTCNGKGASLVVEPNCLSDRATKNYATVCDAELQIKSAKMACRGSHEPQVLKVSLSNSKLAQETEVLTINYLGQDIEVQLDPSTR